MSLAFENDTKVERTNIEPDSYPAVICGVVDLGVQFNRDWKTQEVQTWDDGNPRINHLVNVSFEIPDVTMEIDGEEVPVWISKQYNVGRKAKAIKELVAASNPDAKSFIDLIGAVVLLETGKTSGGNDKIVGVNKLPRAMRSYAGTELVAEPLIFDIDKDNVDEFDRIPEWQKKMIKDQASKEKYLQMQTENSNEEEDGDEDTPY